MRSFKLGVLGLGFLLFLAACSALNAPTPAPESVLPPTATPTGMPASPTVTTGAETAAGVVLMGFTDEGHAFHGALDAPVVIEEFSSYQCPFCARYIAQTYPSLVSRYVLTGKVRYVFRDFPLAGQLQSQPAAEAVNCAGQVGGAAAFWGMHDVIFREQQTWARASDAGALFRAYAEDLDLDPQAFASCVASRETRAKVEADAAEGARRGVSGTPTFFINGQRLVGAQPLEAFTEAIEQALSGNVMAQPTPQIFPTPTPARIAPAEAALALGSPEAPVVLVEFSDYQCPFCARHFAQTWPQIKANFVDTGRVRYMFKDFPLSNIHPQAQKAHEAARCAGEQDAYWEMHALLFAEQAAWSGQSDAVQRFKAFAAQLELDTRAFDACLDEGRWAAAVTADLNEGARLGMSGTPAFFINGYPVIGAQPYELFVYAIELAEQGKLGDAYRPRE